MYKDTIRFESKLTISTLLHPAFIDETSEQEIVKDGCIYIYMQNN